MERSKSLRVLLVEQAAGKKDVCMSHFVLSTCCVGFVLYHRIWSISPPGVKDRFSRWSQKLNYC